MKQPTQVLVLTKARFATIDLNRMAAIRAKSSAVLNALPGLETLTIWEQHDDPFTFLIVSQFATEQDSLRAWGTWMRSPVVDLLNDLMSDPPNTSRFFLRSSTGTGFLESAIGDFLSVSTRISDMGYSPELLSELSGIFEELKMIQGFLGAITGQMIEVDDEVLGLAFWRSIQSFEASIPKNSMYGISLYQRVL